MPDAPAVGEWTPSAVGLASRIAETAGRSSDGLTTALSAFGQPDDTVEFDIDHIGLNLPFPANLLEAIRAAQAAYTALPDFAQERIDQWDPDGCG